MREYEGMPYSGYANHGTHYTLLLDNHVMGTVCEAEIADFVWAEYLLSAKA